MPNASPQCLSPADPYPSRARVGGARLTILLGLVLAAAFAGLAASGAQARPTTAQCLPKTTTVGGRPVVVFCGPAVATIRAVGRTFRIKGGTCAAQLGNVFAQVGTIGGRTAPSGIQTGSLFYVAFNPTNASKGSILYWLVEGKRYRAAQGAKITRVGKRVTFSGKLDRSPGATGSGPFSGTLTC